MGDLRQFTVTLDAFARKVQLAPARVAKRVAFDLFRRIVEKTPVDTGRARASWTISVNQADRTVAPAGQARYPKPKIGMLNVQPGDTIWISNNLPYITRLEDGHSQQAPAGMVKLSIEEVKLKMGALMAGGA